MPELHFSRHQTNLRYTHYLFRFPAKFHPAAVRCLIRRYAKSGSNVLDPFCGSGTLLVEALIAGRHATGIDIDPLSAFITRVKCRPIEPKSLQRNFDLLRVSLDRIRRSSSEYDRLMFDDLDLATVKRFRKRLDIPAIPNIEHWFRNYVIVDLARLRATIEGASVSSRTRAFFLACFASIIRSASNADPVPVSGLEVTSHMRRLNEAGRHIDPFQLFERKVTREIKGMRELWDHSRDSQIHVRRADATSLGTTVRPGAFDLVLTSPPYNTAVDYYRRHTLEMYWLRFVRDNDERLSLREHYIGRIGVRRANARLRSQFTSPYILRLLAHAREISDARERTVRHYCASMQRVLHQVARALRPGGRAVFVVGNAKWNGRSVRATHLLKKLASERFSFVESLSYPARNRYMSYARRNGANVNREYILALKKRP